MGSAEILIVEARPEPLPTAFGGRPATAVVVFGSGRRVAAVLRADWHGPPPLFLLGCPVPGDPFSVDFDPTAWPTRLTTPRHGWIRIETDGSTIRVETERGG